jgi:tetratricopeptide (TPR) repeat protein
LCAHTGGSKDVGQGEDVLMGAGSWRQGRLLLLVAGLGAAAAVPGVLLALRVTSHWAVTVAGVAAAATVAVAAVWQERYSRAAQRSEDRFLKIENGCVVLPTGTLPRVRDMTDPISLGVHPAAAIPAIGANPERPSDRVPVYVPRDIDAELREHLTRSGFVLLVGDSTAGKSRAACEAMQASLPDHVLIAPKNRDVIAAVIAKAAEARRCVVWLDDLEAYLGTGGLSRADVYRVLGGAGHHRVILATLRAAEEDRFTGEEGEGGRQARKDASEVLEQAYRIPVARIFSDAERERARSREWDPRIADALAYAGDYGMAEYMAAGPEAMRDWQNAWNPNTDLRAPSHPRGAALIAAAIDIRRAGHGASLPCALLENVHEHYLNERGGSRLRPESLEDAWRWATRARRATTTLLQPCDNRHVRVFDYLLDGVQRESLPDNYVPGVVVRAALGACAHADADGIAATAYDQGRYALAVAGWRAAQSAARHENSDDPGLLTSRNNLARALRKLGRLDEAAAEHRAVVQARTRILGPEHPDTLISRDNLANVLRDLGHLEEAEAEHYAVLQLLIRILGPEHPYALFSRDNRACTLLELGRCQEAEAEHRAVARTRSNILGSEHPDTLTSRDYLASALRSLGRLDEAEAEYRSVLQARIRILGTGHPCTLVSTKHLSVMLRDLGRLKDAEHLDAS